MRIPEYRQTALLEIGSLLVSVGDDQKAQEAYREILKTEPHNVAARLGLADIFLSLSMLDEAGQMYLELSRDVPDNADIQLGLGECALHMGDFDAAYEALTAASSIRPDDATIQFNLGQVMQHRGDYKAAERLYRSAIAALDGDPACATVWNKLGSLQSEQGDWKKAEQSFRSAVSLLPNYPAALNNLAEVCRELGDLRTAEESFNAAVQADDAYIPARYNRALFQLLLGRYENAWPDYDLRWQVPPLINDPRSLTPTLWQGETLTGKSILIHAEQGIGDTIQFLRFLPLLVTRDAEVTLAVQPGLMHIASMLDRMTVRSLDDLPALTADYHCPLMSLAGRLGITAQTIPEPALIPLASEDLKSQWRDLLSPSGRNIGICWQGNPHSAADRGRSPPLGAFQAVAEIPGNHLISLQKSHGLEQLDELDGAFSVTLNGATFDSGSNAFSDTIALIELVDLVVTGDTAIAHLAASMGKPTWIALKHVPDWRWGTAGSSCPWYPSATLFRQPSPDDWDSVFSSIAERLAADGI